MFVSFQATNSESRDLLSNFPKTPQSSFKAQNAIPTQTKIRYNIS